MRVRLAVQVFSKSVAHGLRFYQNRVPELKDCETTADFCEWMNNMFDALNRREYLKGLKPGNPDFKILEESLSKLDNWEKKVDDKILDKKLFLTKQTAKGLRITLKSMMDLTCTLVNHFGFSELQLGRVNQNALEV
ncbi:uncharacterized protein LOC143908738 [Temnothorax americanus]|uniref:uncharacterized protein LOC143908738 n=1 Tax=Temnothorax americanus TaxID=1964332 RepID=UPI004068CF29